MVDTVTPRVRLPHEETTGQRRIRWMSERGFHASGERDAFALAFLGELPAPEGERLLASIRFEKNGAGSVASRPATVVVTHLRSVPVEPAALAALEEALGASVAPLLAVLAPYLTPPPVAHVALEPCDRCGLKVPEWVSATREDGSPERVCLLCAEGVAL